MTEGPNGPVIDTLADALYEMRVLNEQMRELVALERREPPAPVVNVAPAPITLPAPQEAVSVDYRPLLEALSGLRPDDTRVVATLEALRDSIKESMNLTRAVAGSAYGGGVGSSVVTLGGKALVEQADSQIPFYVDVRNALDVIDRAARLLGHVNVDNFPAVQPVSGTVALAAGTNVIGNVGNSIASYSATGELYVVGGYVALSTTAPQGSLWLSNPVGSGKTLLVTQWSTYCQTGNAKVEYLIDATSAGGALVPFQTNAAGGTSVAVAKIGVGALTGGTFIPAGHIAAMNAPLEKQVPIFLSAGKSLAIRIVGYGLSATAVDFGLNVAFREF